MNHSEYRILRVSYSLHVEDLFVDFAKKNQQQRIVVEIQGFILCVHIQLTIFFQWQQK